MMSSKDKDPRNTPGTEPDPSDAFLDALTERAATDSQANLAAGGRVIESVFDDPMVRQALGVSSPDVPSDRYKDLRAAIIKKNDALLRQLATDDNTYWLKADKTQRRLILKHQFSGAQDSEIAIEIDHDRKVIYIETEAGRVPVSQVAQYIAHSVDLGGEEAYDDDTGEGYQCRRTPWRIVIRSGQQTYRLVITKQLEKNWDFDLRLEPKE